MAGKPAPKSTSSKKIYSYDKSNKLADKPKKRRPGIVSKNTTSNIKTSRNYKKAYRGQGR